MGTHCSFGDVLQKEIPKCPCLHASMPRSFSTVCISILTDERRWLILFFGCTLGVGNATQEFQTQNLLFLPWSRRFLRPRVVFPKVRSCLISKPEARAGNGFLFLQVPFRAECVIRSPFPVGNMLQEIKRGIFHPLRK